MRKSLSCKCNWHFSIIAGDYIEYSLGTFMTISTMAAAALGNTISDVLGIGSAVYVERIVEIIGIKPPDLTPIQLEMKSARRASNLVRIIKPALHVEILH